MRKLTLEGKIAIVKSLVIPKIMHLAIITNVLDTVIEELKQIQKNLWDNKKVKTKHLTQWLQRWCFKECGYKTKNC